VFFSIAPLPSSPRETLAAEHYLPLTNHSSHRPKPSPAPHH
jgi:hypothetical protein